MCFQILNHDTVQVLIPPAARVECDPEQQLFQDCEKQSAEEREAYDAKYHNQSQDHEKQRDMTLLETEREEVERSKAEDDQHDGENNLAC